jgi:hypothetical protein
LTENYVFPIHRLQHTRLFILCQANIVRISLFSEKKTYTTLHTGRSGAHQSGKPGQAEPPFPDQFRPAHGKGGFKARKARYAFGLVRFPMGGVVRGNGI